MNWPKIQRIPALVLAVALDCAHLHSIAFGLLFEMIGTLFVIPLSYATFLTAEDRWKQLWERLCGPRPGACSRGRLGLEPDASDVGQQT